jgi:hypothetical protein
VDIPATPSAPAAPADPAQPTEIAPFSMLDGLDESPGTQDPADLLRPEEFQRAEELKMQKQGIQPMPVPVTKTEEVKLIDIQDDDGTQWFLTLLGRRVGPIGRNLMTELKRKEQTGEITEADLQGL